MDDKVFGIGLSKTGTTSLYAALQTLGLRTATFRHMRNLGLDGWLEGDFSRDYLAAYDAATGRGTFVERFGLSGAIDLPLPDLAAMAKGAVILARRKLRKR